MLIILYEDEAVLVVWKPVGMESQSGRGFDADMVSEIKRYLSTKRAVDNHNLSTKPVEPYVGVIHRLDKPVSGVMVYAKTKRAAAALSEQIQSHKMKKLYTAVVYGKPVNTVDNYVDYLVKTPDGNYSQVVDKGITGAKKAELSYEVLKTIDGEENGMPGKRLSLVKVALKTGRHHQIRVQMAYHGTPLYGDMKYGMAAEKRTSAGNFCGQRESIALCASSLTFFHPVTKKEMTFAMEPAGGVFQLFR